MEIHALESRFEDLLLVLNLLFQECLIQGCCYILRSYPLRLRHEDLCIDRLAPTGYLDIPLRVVSYHECGQIPDFPRMSKHIK